MNLLFLIIGIVIGLSIGHVLFHRYKSVGTLVVDHSDPEDGPYLFLELNDREDVHQIESQKQVIFDVEHRNYISQK